MKNRKMISVFAILLMAFSCNNDDNSESNNVEESGFFSEDVLKVGNKWVYKTYDNRNTISNPADYEFTGKVDSIEVIGVTNVNGVNFFVRRTRSFNINTSTFLGENIYYERINNKGHWVIRTLLNGNETEESGFVRHPGDDFEHTYSQNYEFEGVIEYKLYDNENINVEGKNYEVAPYKGYFIPIGSSEPLLSKTVNYSFNKDIGLVKLICHSVLGSHTWEERLVSFIQAN